MNEHTKNSSTPVDVDAIALSAARDIAMMSGHDRSQFVSKIQVRIIAAINRLHQVREGEVSGWRRDEHGVDVWTIRPTFGEPFEVTRYAPVEQGGRVPEDWHDSIEMARDEFQRIHDMLLPECECDPCPECGRQPSECSGTDCAATCQCSTCDHCRVEDAIRRLEAMLAAAPSQPEDASHE